MALKPSSLKYKQKKNFNDNGYSCLCEYGRQFTGIDLIDWLSALQDFQIGEVHLISVDQDGMNKGVDTNLINLVREHVDVPLVYSGGFNQDIDDISWLTTKLEGLAVASAFHAGKRVADLSQRNN